MLKKTFVLISINLIAINEAPALLCGDRNDSMHGEHHVDLSIESNYVGRHTIAHSEIVKIQSEQILQLNSKFQINQLDGRVLISKMSI